MHQFDDAEHAQYQELLGAAAVDALTDDDRQLLARHLVTCQSCREELATLRMAASALPLTLEAREPPQIVRFRIQAAIQHELGQVSAPGSVPAGPATGPIPSETAIATPIPLRHSRILDLLPWAAAAIFLIAALGLFAWNLSLRNQTSPLATEAIALQPTQANNGATGRLTYLPDRQIFVLSFEHLPALPAGQVYQAWLIQGKTPVSAGVFRSGTSDYAIAGNRSDYQTLAITVEPGPLGTTAPTTAPILTANL